jgi:hypothetical protein
MRQGQLIARRGGNGLGSSVISSSRLALVGAPHSLGDSIQFRWLVFVLRERQRQSVDTRLQAGKAPVRLRLQIREHLPIGRFDCNENFIDFREHLPIARFDCNENFIDSRKHSLDKVDHLEPQGVEFAAQLLYVPLALFTPTVDIAHASPTYFI